MDRIQIRRSEIAEIGPAGRLLPVVFPIEMGSVKPGSWDGWPDTDTNLFRYKPPFFPSLLTYAHHQMLGPRFAVYPVSAADRSEAHRPILSKALFDLQGWAVSVPFLSGLAAILLALVAGWRMFGPASGVLAALIVAVHPAHVAASTRIWPEATLGVCLLISYLLFRRFTKNCNPAGCLLAGAAWALAALTDAAAFLVLPGLAVWVLWTRKKAFYQYYLTFAAGAWFLYQTWPDFVQKSFGASVLDLAGLASVKGSGSEVGAAAFWTGWPALLLLFAAAVISTAVHLKDRAFGSRQGREGKDIGGLWLILLGYAAVRSILNFHAPWDVRAVAPILPFAALLIARLAARRNRS